MQGGESVIETFQKDEKLRIFLENSFDAKSVTSSTIRSNSVGETIDKLRFGIASIDKELNSQVSQHYEELLAQVSNLKHLQHILHTTQQGIDTLQQSIDKIGQEINEPLSLIKSRTVQLTRLHNACEVLRRVIRFLYLARKLKEHIQAGTRELAKAAQCLLELESLRKEGDLNGIEIVDNETRWIVSTTEDVLNSASRMLLQGIETQNQGEVAAALQVFHNLGSLKSKVEQTVADLTKKVNQSIRGTLNFNTDAESQGRDALRQHLWSRIEKMLETLNVCYVQVWHLQRVLSKIRDPSSHVCLLDELVKPGQDTITQSFWKDLTSKLGSELETSAKRSVFIDNTLIADFPKLHRNFNEFWKRLQTHYEMKHSQSAMIMEDRNILFNSITYFKNAYLQRSLTRIFDAINKMFVSNSIPSSEDITTVISTMSSELEFAQVSEDMSHAVTKNIAKGIKYFASKCEALIATDATAIQLTEAASPSQIRNAKIFNTNYLLHSSVTLLANNMTSKAPVTEALTDLDKLADLLLTPLFNALTKRLEQIIYGIHKEEFGSSQIPQAEAQQCSQYVKVLQNQITHFQNAILSKFTPCQWLSNQIKRTVSRAVAFFVRHAALVRPLGEQGKLKLAADMAQLEFAVAPLQPIKELGHPYLALRALRPFIFRETSQIAECPEIGVLLPSTVLHHLFSRAAASLQSPHVVQQWTLTKYSEWMDKHSEEEIWNIIKSALDTYASQVNSRGEKEFSPIYPVILQLGPTLLANFKERENTVSK